MATEIRIQFKTDSTYTTSEFAEVKDSIEDALFDIDTDIVDGSIEVTRIGKDEKAAPAAVSAPQDEMAIVRKWLDNALASEVVALWNDVLENGA